MTRSQNVIASAAKQSIAQQASKQEWIASSQELPCANAARLSQAMTVRDGSNVETQVLDPAARTARGLPIISAPLNCKGRAGMPGARCTRGLVCSPTKENAHEHTGPPKSPGIPARNGFTDYHALSPVRPPGL